LQAAETRNKLSWVPQPGFSCTWFHKNPTFATHTSPTKIPIRRTPVGGDAFPHPPPWIRHCMIWYNTSSQPIILQNGFQSINKSVKLWLYTLHYNVSLCFVYAWQRLNYFHNT